MTGDQRGILVAHVAWPEVMARLKAGAAAVLPIGAACKEHGLHLPMSTDYLQAQWLAQALVQRADVVVWPTLGYGYYPAFVDYPGSCSLAAETFGSAVGEILAGIARAGARRIVVINTGLSTIAPLQQAVEASGRDGVRLVNMYYGPHYRAEAARLQQQPRGGHADELETSIMLVVAPGKVDMDAAVACTDRVIAGVLNRTDPQKPNYSPSGVFGDPTLASADKGRRLLDAMLRDILEALEPAG